MASWTEMANESLRAAKSLKDASLYRSSVSRTYYFAYAAAVQAVVDSGHATDYGDRPNPTHLQLQQMIRRNLNAKRFAESTRRRLSRDLRDLFRSRAAADYDPKSTVDRVFTLNCLRMAAAFQRSIQEV